MSGPIDAARFARHLNLEGVGEEGQRRLLAGSAEVRAGGLRGEVARRYLEASGVGRLVEGQGPPADRGLDAVDESCRAVIEGALDALDEIRHLVGRLRGTLAGARPLSRTMRVIHFGLAAALLCGCSGAAQEPRNPSILPLRTLKLYETGVGYFERSGAVTERNALPVPASHLDDALKSLVILGPGARVQGLTFPSNLSQTMARALVGLPDGSGSFAYRDLLQSLRGAAVEVTIARPQEQISGRLVEVNDEETQPPAAADEPKKEKEKDAEKAPAVKRAMLVVLTSEGALRRVPLEAVAGVRPLDPTFSRRLEASLAAAAPRSAQAQRALRLLGDGGQVTFGYIAETPIWRTSYRVLLDDASSRLQGWALLHNDTDEDWNQIRLSLINGRPDSFLFPLASPRYMRRELLRPDRPLPTTPQLLSKGADEMWTEGEGESFGAGGLGLSGIGEGGGGRGEGIGLGSIGTIGHGSGTGSADSDLLSVGNLASLAQAAGSEQGALFSYSIDQPISLPAHSSALVPFLEQKIDLRQITWIESGARAGIRFENTTGQTLPAGTVSIFSSGGFAGETTIDRLKPGERRFLTFGADMDVEITSERSKRQDEVKRVTAEKERIEEHFLRTTEHELTLVNRSPSAKAVYLVLSLHQNAKVQGADGVDYDSKQSKPVAIFNLAPRQRAERKFSSVEGLSRSHSIGGVDGEQLQKLADSPGLPQEERAALRELAARRSEEVDTAKAISTLDAEMAEINSDIERQRKHLEALGDKGTRPDANPLVRRLLAAEDRLTEARKRLDPLRKQAKARHDAVASALLKLSQKRLAKHLVKHLVKHLTKRLARRAGRPAPPHGARGGLARPGPANRAESEGCEARPSIRAASPSERAARAASAR